MLALMRCMWSKGRGMLELELSYEDGRIHSSRFSVPLLIGRGAPCHLVLKSWRVARQHARIFKRGNHVYLEDLGSLGGTFVNGSRVAEHGPLSIGDEILVGPCRMRVLSMGSGEPASGLDDSFAITDLASEPGCSNPGVDAPGTPRSELHACDRNRLATPSPHAEEFDVRTVLAEPRSAVISVMPAGTGNNLVNHRRRLHKALLEALDLRRRDILSLSDEVLRNEAAAALSAILADDEELPAGIDREELLAQVVDEAVGLGPLEPLLADPDVSEIMVNSCEDIYVERGGRLHKSQASFSSEQAVRSIIDRIVAPLGRRVDESSPMVDARLKDGSRLNAVIPPVALRGPCLTIRKFPQRRLAMQDLIAAGSLDRHMAGFLNHCVVARKSILVSGGTGSGKTTLLNILSNCIPDGERIITIEDAAELRLNHAHLVSLEARPPNTEGKGKIDIRDLVRNALRMRPDRIIVGECRGAEAFDMLAAMNTGHEGSLSTLHANSPRDAIARLETMILMAGMELPLAAIREHIAAAVDLIIQQARLSDGRRLITSIVEVTGMEGMRIQTQELFRYRADERPRFEGCGVMPECFGEGGIAPPLELLSQTTFLAETTERPAWS